jgi:hypothetical protein
VMTVGSGPRSFASTLTVSPGGETITIETPDD